MEMKMNNSFSYTEKLKAKQILREKKIQDSYNQRKKPVQSNLQQER